MAESIWRQRRYQVACLVLIAFVVAATCGALLASRSIQSALKNDDSKLAASSSKTETFAPDHPLISDIPSMSPTRTATEMSVSPSLRPTALKSQYPSLQPSDSINPSRSPSELPSFSMAPSPDIPDHFGIYVMGDIPYAPWEELMLVQQLAAMKSNMNPLAFMTVHVGDIQKPLRTLCVESQYAMVRQYLLEGPLPIIVATGDNDWVDCPDPMAALGYHRKYFEYFYQNWNNSAIAPNSIYTTSTIQSLKMLSNSTKAPNKTFVAYANSPLSLIEHHPIYQELWRLNYNGALLIGIQLMNYKGLIADAEQRMQASIKWLRSSILDTSIQVIAMFGHGQFQAETKMFFEGIVSAFSGIRTNLPLLYFHGDGHKWDMNDKVQSQLNWPSFVDIQVDQGGLADPLFIEFSLNPAVPLTQEHDLQYVLANGMVRLDRQRGRYPTENGRPNIDTLFPQNY